MKILFSYLSKHRWVVVLALVLAGFNIGFSLLDPMITGKIMDKYIVPKDHKYHTFDYRFYGALGMVGLAVGAAMVSRIAKNFQDYFTNIITQKVGAEMYADGLKHSLELPYSVFEDQRSGETLGILQKVRTDTERLISSFINILYVSLVGIVWVMVYSIRVNWLVGPAYFITIPLLGIVSSVLSKKIKT